MDTIKSQISFWEDTALKYAAGSSADTAIQFLQQALSPAQAAISLIEEINNKGYDYIGSATLNVTQGDIDDMVDKQTKLYDFCSDIHYELQRKVDGPFAKDMGLLADELYAINPNNITVTKDGILWFDKELSLYDLILPTIDDDQLKSDFETNYEALQDVPSEDFYEAMYAVTTALVTGADVTTLTTDDKELFVHYYEILHSEHADAMDTLFDNIPADTPMHSFSNDVLNIKLITYTAPEPYRSVFLKYAPLIEISTYDYNDTLHYKDFTNKLYINFVDNNYGINNPRGAYVTFFHECGHAIDDLSKTDLLFWGKFSVWEYQNESGQTLQNVVENDVRQHLTNSVNMAIIEKNITLEEVTPDDIVNMIMSPNSPSSLDNENNNEVYQAVLSYYDRPTITESKTGKLEWDKIVGNKYYTQGVRNEAVSDIYGGVTNNTIGFGYMHRPDDDELNEPYIYWYSKTGISTQKQSTEFFAEYFSYNMTKSPMDQLTAVDEYLPNSGSFVDEMMENLL